jgi:hypothetical protein
LILGGEAFVTSYYRASDYTTFDMLLNVSFKLWLIKERCRTHVACVFTSRCHLRLNHNAVRGQMMIQLRYRMKFAWTLSADILLNFMMCLHMIIQISHLGE